MEWVYLAPITDNFFSTVYNKRPLKKTCSLFTISLFIATNDNADKSWAIT